MKYLVRVVWCYTCTGKIQSFKTNIVDLVVDRVHADSEIDFIVAKEEVDAI